MHRWFLPRKSLEQKLPEFVDGYFLIVTAKVTKANIRRFLEIQSSRDLGGTSSRAWNCRR